jgi:Cu/Ag efflux pump CusA
VASPTADFANYTALNIEAYPDPAPPIIEIIAQRPGQSPEEMERYVTIPIEIAIANTPGLRYIRSNTVYALMDWPVMIGDRSVPMWASWIGLVVAGGLAFFGLRLAERDAR